jgi:hypothetical protein
MLEESHCRAIWAALKTGRGFTLEDLMMTTCVDVGKSLTVLNRLTQAGWVSMEGIRLAGSGEALTMFWLAKRPGDVPYEPPYDVMMEAVEKPEKAGATEAKKPYGGKLTISIVEPATQDEPVMRLRIAAHSMQLFPNRERLFEHVGFDPDKTRQYKAAFKSLRRAGEIVREKHRIDTGYHYEYWDCRHIFSGVAFMRGRVGEEVTLKQLNVLEIPIEGKNIPGMLKVLAEEGWRALVAYKGRTNQIEWMKIEEK